MPRPGPFLVLTAMALIGGACAKPQEQLDRSRINIKVLCNGNNLHVIVNPFAAAVRRNARATWSLDNEAHAVNSVTIEPKDPNNWPFDGASSYTVPKGGSVQSGAVKADAPVRTPFPYNIKATCSFPDAPSREILIDPDMIIID